MSTLRSLAAFVAAAILTVSSASAQGCFVDDGFHLPGACCAPAFPNLPQFPAMTIPSLGACFENCNPIQQFQSKIDISPQGQFFCDVFLSQITITGLVNTNPALLISKYSRTWFEITPTGAQRQVWRFLINVDINYIVPATATAPCPYPKTALNGLACHFIGSLDYARDCGTAGAFSAAINLTHLCGDFMHNQFSLQPITPNPNPNHMYSFVGPTPFIYGFAPVPSGVITADAVRSNRYNFVTSPLQWDCLTEVPVTPGGLLSSQQQHCACEDPTQPSLPLWTNQTLNFNYGCNFPGPLPFSLMPFFLAPATGLRCLTLGRYAVPAGSYPGPESVNLYMGLATSQDPCVANAFPFHLITGVGTVGGDQAFIVNQQISTAPIPTTQFLDLENVLVLIGGPPYIAIGIGGIFLSTQLWQLNM
ncbi:MAG: hypothetical protein ACKVS6_00295 [Planctomycetota bacterium]